MNNAAAMDTRRSRHVGSRVESIQLTPEELPGIHSASV